MSARFSTSDDSFVLSSVTLLETLRAKPSTGVNVPGIWLFPVDDGDQEGGLVFSGESSSATPDIVMAYSQVFTEVDRATGTWTTTWHAQSARLNVGTIRDHWHIFAHGHHWISYSVDSLTTPAVEIWLMKVKRTSSSFDKLLNVQIGWTSGGTADAASPLTQFLGSSSVVSTNDHFMVATHEGVAVGVRTSSSHAKSSGHTMLFVDKTTGVVTLSAFGLDWSASGGDYDHTNMASAIASNPPLLAAHKSSIFGSKFGKPDLASATTSLPTTTLGGATAAKAGVVVLAPDADNAYPILGTLANGSAASTSMDLFANQIEIFTTDETFSEASSNPIKKIGLANSMCTKATLSVYPKDTFTGSSGSKVVTYQAIVLDEATLPAYGDLDRGDIYIDVLDNDYNSILSTGIADYAQPLTPDAKGICTYSHRSARPHSILWEHDGDYWLVTGFDYWTDDYKNKMGSGSVVLLVNYIRVF